MNWEHKDWVSFLKELMEFILGPSNHLIDIVLRMDNHPLLELTYMLYRVRSAIIHGER